ncbi:TetR/AcrR family transcriptional regulator [Paenisporosarcina cavernae]|uniref:TetR/AcrR family transcriptional regulator n=1 Tax=Paenisporosarcina cavernae TaxID=2320858 RepID=A0A385YWA5_9BACL|nr:TetR/AcrR family transcriptional regulator [Paenisporosarcina cavernae]AYC30751.1 TetR/AcrR family transcriptional regulator [Paenisporosarcina cavernae]
MIRGAVALFKQKGYHRTTTREIAKEAGFSIGTLYEYIRTKEDVLYLVCDSIYEEVQQRLSGIAQQEGSLEGLEKAIRQYYELIDEMQDEFVVMYQESKSLPKDALEYVLNKELEMVALFENILRDCQKAGEIHVKDESISLAAHHLVIQGQMWAFRRWGLHSHYTLDQFMDDQLQWLLHGIKGNGGTT